MLPNTSKLSHWWTSSTKNYEKTSKEKFKMLSIRFFINDFFTDSKKKQNQKDPCFWKEKKTSEMSRWITARPFCFCPLGADFGCVAAVMYCIVFGKRTKVWTRAIVRRQEGIPAGFYSDPSHYVSSCLLRKRSLFLLKRYEQKRVSSLIS